MDKAEYLREVNKLFEGKPSPMKPTTTRYEMSQTEATAIHRYYQQLPETERAEIGAMADALAGGIRNLGATSAVGVLWAVGRLMRREG